MSILIPTVHRPRLALVAVLSLVLAGCAASGGTATQPGGTVRGSQGTALGDDLSGFLARSPAGAVVNLADSPLGENIEVVAEAPYYAASGRECRRLQVEAADGPSRQVVACESAQGWETRRLVTEATSTTSSTGSPR